MHGTFLQRVFLTIFLGLVASGFIEFYKNIIQRADNDINRDWRTVPAASPTP